MIQNPSKMYFMPLWNRIGHIFLEPVVHRSVDPDPDSTLYFIPDLPPANAAADRIARRLVNVCTCEEYNRRYGTSLDFGRLYGASQAPQGGWLDGIPLACWRNEYLIPSYERFRTSPASVRLFSLTEEEIEQARRIERGLGIDAQTPVVALHMREPGYLPHLPYHSYRDATTANYEPSVDYLLSLGYQVVRVGDPSMTPLSRRKGVWDLPHLQPLDPLADIWFILRSRFMLGAPSGPLTIAQYFENGPPVLLANKIPAMPMPLPPGSRMLPKHHYCKAQGRNLSLREIKTQALEFSETEAYHSHGLRIDENLPEVILEAVKEMVRDLDRGDCAHLRLHPLQKRYNASRVAILQFKQEHGLPYMMIETNRVATSFLERYPEYLD